MSLVTEVFDFVKTNPGVDGIQIQNHFSNTVVSDTISDLESRNAIKWTSRGYYTIKQQITELKLSLDDFIKYAIEILLTWEIQLTDRKKWEDPA